MSIMIKNLDMPKGCQKCKLFKKHLFGNGLDYSYSCILGAKDFPMPWIRQMEERASDCPIKPSEQEPVLDKIRAEIDDYLYNNEFGVDYRVDIANIIDKYKAESEG